MRTYTHSIPSIVEIMRDIVSEVNDNLTSDVDLSIDRVNFKAETWLELIKRLNEDSLVMESKYERYPLVALIRNFTETIEEGEASYETSLDIVIVTLSDPNKTSTEREEENYTPVLIPIYQELMEVINSSSYFLGTQSVYKSHTRSFNMHLGQESEYGNTAYKLPDCVDGIVVEGLKLKVDISNCQGFFYGGSVSLVYQNQVKELACASLGSHYLEVELITAIHENSYFVSLPSPVTGIYYSHLDTETTSFTPVDISNVADGFYTGYVYQDDTVTKAKLSFAYIIHDGIVRGCTSSMYNALTNFILSGFEYINYPFNVEFYADFTYDLIESYEISTAGNVLFEDEYTPHTNSIPLTVKEVQLPVPSGNYRDILTNIIINGESLENFAYYKTI